MISNPLPLFDDEIYGLSLENLKTDARDISIRPRNLPFVEAGYVFSPAFAKMVALQSPAKPENEFASDKSFDTQHQNYLSESSRFMTDEESDIYLLKMRMSNLQFSARGTSMKMDQKQSMEQHVSVDPILLEKDLRMILQVLQCQSSSSVQIQSEASAIACEINRLLVAQDAQHSPIKRQRLLQYYISLQNVLGLLDILNDQTDQQQSISSYSKIVNGLTSPDISFNLRNRDDISEDFVSVQENVRNQLSTLDLEKPNPKRRLEQLLQEMALLPSTTASEVDNRLKEAEEALIETIQRLQQQQLLGENLLDERMNLELQHRRQYLHKLLEIYELLTLPEEAMFTSSKTSTSPARKNSSPKKATLRSLSAERKDKRSMSPSIGSKKKNISVNFDSNKTHATIENKSKSHSLPLQESLLTPSKFGRTLLLNDTLPMSSPISEKLSMDALRMSSSSRSFPLTSRNSVSPNHTNKSISAYTPIDSLLSSPASTSASVSGSFRIRADSLSPTPFHRTTAPVSTANPITPASTSTSLYSQLHTSSIPTRAVSPLLFTSPVPPKSYQSPLLNARSPTLTYKNVPPVSNSTPPEGRKRAISPSLLQSSSTSSPARRIPFTTNNNNNYVRDDFTNINNFSSNSNNISPTVDRPSQGILLQKNHVTFASTVHSSPITTYKSVASAPNSVAKDNYDNSNSSILTDVQVPSANTSLIGTSPAKTPTSVMNSAPAQKTLKTVRSFSAKDALVLQELLESLKLNIHTTRSELDQAMHSKQQSLQVALKAGQREEAQVIKAELEKLRAAYRLVALRG